MSVVIWIVMGVLFGSLIFGGVGYIDWRHNAIINGAGKRVTSSKASRKIMKDYLSLPNENRPMPQSTLEAALAALDVKHDVDKVNNHFTTRDYDSSYFNWDECRYKDGCWCTEYKELHFAIADIARAVAEQKHAFAVAGIAHQLDRVQEITQTLRDEKDIITQVTKELTNV